jgi:hypothetical protein
VLSGFSGRQYYGRHTACLADDVHSHRIEEDILYLKAIQVIPEIGIAAFLTMVMIWTNAALPVALMIGALFLAISLTATARRNGRERARNSAA